MLTDQSNSEFIGGVSTLVMQAAERAIIRYAMLHSKFIENMYEWFSRELGYKSEKFIYHCFQGKEATKLGWKDIRKILQITQDMDLFNALQKDLGIVMERIPAIQKLELIKNEAMK